LNNIPTNLIDRVEVVTGGASALYGADAVAGVVNLILDKKFSGLDLESSFGRSQAGDKDTVYLSLKGGTDFGGGNGHLIVGAEFENDDGTGGCSSRDWCNQNTNILANPTPGVNGLPANLRLSNSSREFTERPDYLRGPGGNNFHTKRQPDAFQLWEAAWIRYSCRAEILTTANSFGWKALWFQCRSSAITFSATPTMISRAASRICGTVIWPCHCEVR